MCVKSDKILIVDDNETILNTIIQILNGFDYHEIFSFTDSKCAMDFLLKNDVDVVISDLEMPNISGYDIALAAQKKNIQRIIITSGNHDIEVLDSIMMLTGVQFLPKPFIIGNLIKMVETKDFALK